jgi:ABC-type proline/glycine betaine transport system ATPase subunit
MRSKKPLIEAMGVTDISRALRLMGMVSLSDAFVYLKRFDELSAGQQYRALLAKLISGKANVWIADEFCTNLDPIAASSVAARMSQLARMLKAVLIVATPQPEAIARALKPDTVIRLTTAWEHQILSGDAFISHLVPRPATFRVPRIAMDNRSFTHLKKRRGNTISIVPSIELIQTGPTRIKAHSKSFLASVISVRHSTIAEMTIKEIRAAGYASKGAALKSLRRRRKNIEKHTPVTVLETEWLQA